MTHLLRYFEPEPFLSRRQRACNDKDIPAQQRTERGSWPAGLVACHDHKQRNKPYDASWFSDPERETTLIWALPAASVRQTPI